MKNQHKPLFWMTILTLFGMFLVACNSQPLPTTVPIANHTPVPSHTFTATASATSSPSPTFTPSATATTPPTSSPTVTRTTRPTNTPLPPTPTPSATPTPAPTATPLVLSPVDLSGANQYLGAGIAPDNVGNLQKLNSWGKGAAVWASYSPDGSQVAVLTEEKFYLYQAGSDNEIYAVSAPAGQWFVSAAASSDWQWLALGLNDERVLVYTLANNSFQYEINSQAVVGMQFLPNTTILLTREWGWNVATNQPVTTNFPGGVISADGQTVALNSGDEFITTGRLAYVDNNLQYTPLTPIADKEQISSPELQIALPPDGSKLAIASWNPTIEVWDTQTGETIYTVDVQFPEKLVSTWSSKSRRFLPAKFSGPGRYYGASVAFSPDGKWLIAHNGDNDLLFWEADTGKFVQRWADAEKNISFTADLTQAITWNGSLTQWRSTGEKLFEHPTHVYSIFGATFLPQNNTLLLGTGDLIVLDTPYLQPLNRFDPPTFYLTLLGDQETVVFQRYSEVFFHHLPTGRLTIQHHPQGESFEYFTTSPDGRWFGNVIRYEADQLWQIEKWENVLDISAEGLETVNFTADSQYFIQPANYDGVINFWALPPANETEPAFSLPVPDERSIGPMAVSPNGQYLVANNYVYDLQTQTLVTQLVANNGEPILISNGSFYGSLAFTPDSQLFLVTIGNKLTIWRTADWSVVHTMDLNRGVGKFAISADGRLLVLFGSVLELWGIPQ